MPSTLRGNDTMTASSTSGAERIVLPSARRVQIRQRQMANTRATMVAGLDGVQMESIGKGSGLELVFLGAVVAMSVFVLVVSSSS